MENDRIRAIISGDEPYAYVSMEKMMRPYGRVAKAAPAVAETKVEGE